MTLCVAWIRRINTARELVVATDSKLTGGGFHWIGCPKIMIFPRSDCVMCFAGETIDAYPLMLQARNAIEGHYKVRSRALDITELVGHIGRIFNDMIRRRTLVVEKPDAKFILAGYSWKEKDFRIYSLVYKPHDSECNNKELVESRGRKNRAKRKNEKNDQFVFQMHKNYHFIGDHVDMAEHQLTRKLLARIKILSEEAGAGNSPYSLAISSARYSLFELFDKRMRRLLRNDGCGPGKSAKKWRQIIEDVGRGELNLDYEPFEVLRDIIVNGKFSSIGGPPQLVKVYEHMNCLPYGVYWPSRKSRQVTVLGRKLLPYEKTGYIVLDPHSLNTYEIRGKFLRRQNFLKDQRST